MPHILHKDYTNTKTKIITLHIKRLHTRDIDNDDCGGEYLSYTPDELPQDSNTDELDTAQKSPRNN